MSSFVAALFMLVLCVAVVILYKIFQVLKEIETHVSFAVYKLLIEDDDDN